MKTLDKGRRVVGGERRTVRDELRARYEGGESIREIADDIGRSYGFVHRVLGEAGTTLRGRGGQARPRTSPAE